MCWLIFNTLGQYHYGFLFDHGTSCRKWRWSWMGRDFQSWMKWTLRPSSTKFALKTWRPLTVKKLNRCPLKVPFKESLAKSPQMLTWWKGTDTSSQLARWMEIIFFLTILGSMDPQRNLFFFVRINLSQNPIGEGAEPRRRLSAFSSALLRSTLTAEITLRAAW